MCMLTYLKKCLILILSVMIIETLISFEELFSGKDKVLFHFVTEYSYSQVVLPLEFGSLMYPLVKACQRGIVSNVPQWYQISVCSYSQVDRPRTVFVVHCSGEEEYCLFIFLYHWFNTCKLEYLFRCVNNQRSVCTGFGTFWIDIALCLHVLKKENQS